MPFYRIQQHVVHTIVVRADSEEQADRFAGEMGDDDFTDWDWGDTTLTEVPERLAPTVYEDIRREK
jgi:hypothetical protein